MDAGRGYSSCGSSSSVVTPGKFLARFGLQEKHRSQRSRTSNKEIWDCDRFIPNRSAMDMDYARSLLTDGRRIKTNNNGDHGSVSCCSEYRKQLDETFNMNKDRRIMAFKYKPPPQPVELIPQEFFGHLQQKFTKPKRHIPQKPEKTLDAPDLSDDYNLNLLDWGCRNVLAIALGNSVYLWDAEDHTCAELVTVDDDSGPVTSLSWALDGCQIAVGLNSSEIQLWDAIVGKKVRNIGGAHHYRVGALTWNSNQILTSGGMEGNIVNNDVRTSSDIVQTFRGGHRLEICGLNWSDSGTRLASGGNDSLIHIWDCRSVTASSNSTTRYLHRLEDHRAAVKALAWSPFQKNLLASGGGFGDECIKFWSTGTGACLNSIDTGSPVCALLWSKSERELLSAHGMTQNQLNLWRYPSMAKIAELTDTPAEVVFLSQSPNGCTIAAAGHETLRFYNFFGDPGVAKAAAPTADPRPFQHLDGIR